MKKFSLFLFMLFLIFTQLFSQVSDKNKKNAKTAYNSAVENIRNLNFPVALTYLDAAVDLDPGLNNALIQRAKVKVELGKTKEALKDFTLAGEKDPKNGEPDFYLGYLAFTTDTSQLVINKLNSAISKGYTQPQVYYYRGLYYLMVKNYSTAITDFTSAIELKSDYALAYHDRATAKRGLGDFQGALYDYRMAVNYQNNFPLAFNNMGSVKIALGDYEGALADYSVAIKLNPDFYIAYNNRGTAKYYLGQPDSALIDFNKAIEIQPNYIPALNNKAAGLSKNMAYTEAIGLFNQILESDNTFGKAYLNRGLVRELTGDLEGACTDWKKALELGITDAEKYLKECK
jgi:tetratricopeptide (TPR) repeat protein